MFRKGCISILIWSAVISLIVLLFFVMLFFTIILYPFDRKRKFVHTQCFWWSDAVICLNPYWDIKVGGLENIDKTRTYVVVANHQWAPVVHGVALARVMAPTPQTPRLVRVVYLPDTLGTMGDAKRPSDAPPYFVRHPTR